MVYAWLAKQAIVSVAREHCSPAKEAAQTEANLVQGDQGLSDGCFHRTRIGLQPLRVEHTAGFHEDSEALVLYDVCRSQVPALGI